MFPLNFVDGDLQLLYTGICCILWFAESVSLETLRENFKVVPTPTLITQFARCETLGHGLYLLHFF